MLSRSSSNPVIGTLFSGSPNRDIDTITKHHLSFHGNLKPFPVSKLNQEAVSHSFKSFRRYGSDSNLENLVYPDKEELQFSAPPKKFPKIYFKTIWRSAPSFSIFNVNDRLEDEEIRVVDVGKTEEVLIRTVTSGENIEANGIEDFSFGNKCTGLIEEEGEEEQEESLNGIRSLNLEEVKEPVSPPLYLDAGLGINGNDFGGGGGGDGLDLTLPNFDESGDLIEYYKRMVDEYPCHPLFLANYAQVLQSNGDLHEAEEYYYRATLADPKDGGILLKFAKLEWQLHHDQDRALSNFEHAVRAAPQDSNVLAAYASFLWEINDDGEEYLPQKPKHIKEENLIELVSSAANQDFEPLQLPPSMFRIDVGDRATSDTDNGNDVEEYYKKMIEENPSNSLVLRNYAQFLYQSNGDLLGAEEYYSRALVADPGDGETMSQYAKMVWEVHRDHDKALSYFERAVKATPEDSYVLAAYASFLGVKEEKEEDITSPDQFQEAIHSSVIAAAQL